MTKRTILAIVSAILILAMSACATGNVWEDAIYERDTELGEGAKTITVVVTANDKSVTFTIHTDENMLSDALLEHGLIEGEDGPYGLYVKKVNGMTADYDVNSAYWAFKQNGEYLMSGADFTPILDGDKFDIVYEKN
jgi:hypothetical protein